MNYLYDWNNNVIKFKDKYDNMFNIQLRGQVTIITGSSASGKTLLCNRIKNIQRDKNINQYNTDNIFIVNEDNIDKLSIQKNKLIIIDRAELILSNNEVDIINNDRCNRYLVFVRKPIGIETTPNHYAELIRKDKETIAHYDFNVKGWC